MKSNTEAKANEGGMRGSLCHNERMKQKEMIEGPEAFERFRRAVKTVISVPKSVVVPEQPKIKPRRKETGRKRSVLSLSASFPFCFLVSESRSFEPPAAFP